MTGWRGPADSDWLQLGVDEKRAAVHVLLAQGCTRVLAAERLGCDVKSVSRYSAGAPASREVVDEMSRRYQPARERGSLKRDCDVWPRRP